MIEFHSGPVKVALSVEGTRILLSGETKPIYIRINMVPGARWHPVRKVWSFPATLTVARRLTEALPEASVDEKFAAMVAQAEIAGRAPQHKTAEELPPIPITKTAPWKHQVVAYWFVLALWGDPSCPK